MPMQVRGRNSALLKLILAFKTVPWRPIGVVNCDRCSTSFFLNWVLAKNSVPVKELCKKKVAFRYRAPVKLVPFRYRIWSRPRLFVSRVLSKPVLVPNLVFRTPNLP